MFFKEVTHILTSLTHKWEKAMAPHSSTLAWKISWMEEPGRLQSMWLLRVAHVTAIFSYYFYVHGLL